MFLGFTVSGRQLQSLARDIAVEVVAGARMSTARRPRHSSARSSTSRMRSAARSERWEFQEWPRRPSRPWPAPRIPFVSSLPHWRRPRESRRACDDKPSRDGICGATRSADRSGTRRTGQCSLGTAHRRLHRAPLSTRRRRSAIERVDRSHAGAWICASGQRFAIGDDFRHFTVALASPMPFTARFGSPFDYATQAPHVSSGGIDDPSSSRHTRQVVEAALRTCSERRPRVSSVHEPSRVA